MSFRAKSRNLRRYAAGPHGLCLHHDQRDQNAVYLRDERPSEARYEHKCKLTDGFTKKYNVTWLAYYEVTSDVSAALTREKQLKTWGGSKKIALIQSMNPQWKDLAREWQEQ